MPLMSGPVWNLTLVDYTARWIEVALLRGLQSLPSAQNSNGYELSLRVL